MPTWMWEKQHKGVRVAASTKNTHLKVLVALSAAGGDTRTRPSQHSDGSDDDATSQIAQSSDSTASTAARQNRKGGDHHPSQTTQNQRRAEARPGSVTRAVRVPNARFNIPQNPGFCGILNLAFPYNTACYALYKIAHNRSGGVWYVRELGLSRPM